MLTFTRLPLLLAFALCATPALAEKADKDKPVNLEADRITVDDINRVHILEGNVVLTKGTMVLRTDKLVVSQDSNGFQTAIAYGGKDGLARFRQKREGRNEYMEGEAERIEHNDRNEKTEFFKRAYVKSGQDEVSGSYIQYDARAESYAVNNGGSKLPGNTPGATPGGRVHAVIQPKNAGKDDAAPPEKNPPSNKK